MTLVDFLLARIAEDEDRASLVTVQFVDTSQGVPQIQHRAIRDRVLAECEAKRRIVSLCGKSLGDDLRAARGEWDETAWRGDQVLRALALPFADHPDYDEAWRP